MSEKLGQEAAFGRSPGQKGMSKRFYAACAAMQGILANSEISIALSKAYPKADEYDNLNKQLTKLSYMHADELLKQENDGS